jgi:hypothetical protein
MNKLTNEEMMAIADLLPPPFYQSTHWDRINAACGRYKEVTPEYPSIGWRGMTPENNGHTLERIDALNWKNMDGEIIQWSPKWVIPNSNDHII